MSLGSLAYFVVDVGKHDMLAACPALTTLPAILGAEHEDGLRRLRAMRDGRSGTGHRCEGSESPPQRPGHPEHGDCVDFLPMTETERHQVHSNLEYTLTRGSQISIHAIPQISCRNEPKLPIQLAPRGVT